MTLAHFLHVPCRRVLNKTWYLLGVLTARLCEIGSRLTPTQRATSLLSICSRLSQHSRSGPCSVMSKHGLDSIQRHRCYGHIAFRCSIRTTAAMSREPRWKKAHVYEVV
ncbi:hypothetical protein C8Q76DRAFT_762869 [Earliella scabrosa]|nr:hypothetical protein C8Q76DRAFT_762869 [Earliella scabrosa]